MLPVFHSRYPTAAVRKSQTKRMLGNTILPLHPAPHWASVNKADAQVATGVAMTGSAALRAASHGSERRGTTFLSARRGYRGYHEVPMQPKSTRFRQRIIVLGVMLSLGVLLAAFITTWATRTSTQKAAAPERADRPPSPALLAQYRGRFSNDEQDATIHIFTGDPGALGAGYMWIYAEVADEHDQFPIVLRTRIPTGDLWNFQWIGRDVIEVEHLTDHRRTTQSQVRVPLFHQRDGE